MPKPLINFIPVADESEKKPLINFIPEEEPAAHGLRARGEVEETAAEKNAKIGRTGLPALVEDVVAPVVTAGEAAGKALPFGATESIAAGIRELGSAVLEGRLPSKEGYQSQLGQIQGAQQTLEQEHPVAATTGKVGGTVVRDVGIGKVVSPLLGIAGAAPTIVGRVGQSALQGAAIGGIGSGAETAAEGGDVADVAKSALAGAGIGAGAGAGAGLITEGALAGARHVGQIFSSKPTTGQITEALKTALPEEPGVVSRMAASTPEAAAARGQLSSEMVEPKGAIKEVLGAKKELGSFLGEETKTLQATGKATRQELFEDIPEKIQSAKQSFQELEPKFQQAIKTLDDAPGSFGLVKENWYQNREKILGPIIERYRARVGPDLINNFVSDIDEAVLAAKDGTELSGRLTSISGNASKYLNRPGISAEKALGGELTTSAKNYIMGTVASAEGSADIAARNAAYHHLKNVEKLSNAQIAKVSPDAVARGLGQEAGDRFKTAMTQIKAPEYLSQFPDLRARMLAAQQKISEVGPQITPAERASVFMEHLPEIAQKLGPSKVVEFRGKIASYLDKGGDLASLSEAAAKGSQSASDILTIVQRSKNPRNLQDLAKAAEETSLLKQLSGLWEGSNMAAAAKNMALRTTGLQPLAPTPELQQLAKTSPLEALKLLQRVRSQSGIIPSAEQAAKLGTVIAPIAATEATSK